MRTMESGLKMLRIVLFLAPIVHSAHEHCILGWTRFGNSCFSFSDDFLTWHEALDVCDAYGGRLAQVDSQEKQDWLAVEMKIRLIQHAWIGGSSGYHAATWEWIPSFEPFNYTKWHDGKPNDLESSKCVWAEASMGYEWNNGPCSTLIKFICERKEVEKEAQKPVDNTSCLKGLLYKVFINAWIF